MRAGQHAVPRAGDQHLGQQLLARQIDLGWPAAEVAVLRPGPLAAAELLEGLSQQQQRLAGLLEAHRRPATDVVEQADHADDGRRVDGGARGGVVEADVAARHRGAQHGARLGQPAGGLGELPHHLGVLRTAEVQAVGHGDGHGAGGGDVAVGLRQGELRPGVRVEAGVAPVAVGGQRDTEPGLLREPYDAGVLRPGEHRVAEHDPVVLLHDPPLAAQVGAADHRQ